MNQPICITIFCNNIKLLRSANGLSKTAMAKKLHITTKTLTSIEKGVCPPHTSAKIIFHASKAFGIHPKNLFAPLEHIEKQR